MKFLEKLGVGEFNPGACFGHDEWSETTDQGLIESFNPATGEVLREETVVAEDRLSQKEGGAGGAEAAGWAGGSHGGGQPVRESPCRFDRRRRPESQCPARYGVP